MVDTQVRPSDVTKYPIIKAMLSVPRETYVRGEQREVAYAGSCIDLGNGRAILEPRTFAKMLDAIDIAPDELVLDVGCGLGYSSAVIACLAEAVVALESDADMAGEAERILGENGADNVAVITGHLSAGAAKHGPYDAIIIEGAVEIIADQLVGQLKDGGRIAAIFRRGNLGNCRIGHKSDGQLFWKTAFDANAPVLKEFEKTREFEL